MASNWRAIDEVTFSYCYLVAQRIKERYAELLSQACCGGFQQNKQSKQEKTTTKAQSPTRAVNADEEDAEEEDAEEEDEEEEEEDEVADGEDAEEDTDEEDTDEADAEEEERSPNRTPQFPDNTITAADVLLTLSNMPAAVTPTSSVPTIFHENAVHQDYCNHGQHAGSTLTHSDVFLGERSSEQSAHDDIAQIENCHDFLQGQCLNDHLPLEQVADVHHWWVKYGNFEDFFAVDV